MLHCVLYEIWIYCKAYCRVCFYNNCFWDRLVRQRVKNYFGEIPENVRCLVNLKRLAQVGKLENVWHVYLKNLFLKRYRDKNSFFLIWHNLIYRAEVLVSNLFFPIRKCPNLWFINCRNKYENFTRYIKTSKRKSTVCGYKVKKNSRWETL